MDSRDYEKQLKKAKDLEHQIVSQDRKRVIGNLITFPKRVVGWVMKVVAIVVGLGVIFAIIAGVIKVVATGNSKFLDALR